MESEPTVITNDGTQFWYMNGERHREDEPAVIYPDGKQFWYKNGKCHREDGPAAIYPDGTHHWYINDHDITNKIKEWAKDRDINLNNLTDIDKMIIKLEWGNYGK